MTIIYAGIVQVHKTYYEYIIIIMEYNSSIVMCISNLQLFIV